MSVFVVRAFVKLRAVLATHKELAGKLSELQHKVGTHDKVIVSIIATIRQLTEPAKQKARLIGFRSKREEPTEPAPKPKAFVEVCKKEVEGNCWKVVHSHRPRIISPRVRLLPRIQKRSHADRPSQPALPRARTASIPGHQPYEYEGGTKYFCSSLSGSGWKAEYSRRCDGHALIMSAK